MKVILVMVMSLDGKTTKGNSSDIYTWTSKEDQNYFSKLVKNHSVIIMGKNTYHAAKKIIKPTPKTLRIVLTKNSNQFIKSEISGQLEFISSSPNKLIEHLSKQGYKNALLVGGAKINEAFLKARLIDELWITVEPLIFGKGNGLIADQLNVKLKLKSIEKLNKKGTLLLKYKPQ